MTKLALILAPGFEEVEALTAVEQSGMSALRTMLPKEGVRALTLWALSKTWIR